MKRKGEAEKAPMGKIDGVDLKLGLAPVLKDGVTYLDRTGLIGSKTSHEKIGSKDAEKITELKVTYLKDSSHHFAPKGNYVVLNYAETTGMQDAISEKGFSLFLRDGMKGGKVNLTFYNQSAEEHGIEAIKLTAEDIAEYVKQLNNIFNENSEAYKWLAKQRGEKPPRSDLRSLAQK